MEQMNNLCEILKASCKQPRVKNCKKKCKKEDPIVGTYTVAIVFPTPIGGTIPVYGTVRYMADGSAIAGDSAGLGQLAQFAGPNYIDSVFTGNWKKVGHNQYEVYFTWIENQLIGPGGNTFPTNPRARRACLARLTMVSPSTLTGSLSVNEYALSDATLSNPTHLVTGTITDTRWSSTQIPSLFPA